MLRFANHGVEMQVRARLRVRRERLAMLVAVGVRVPVASQQGIDVGSAAVPRLGDERQVGRERIVVRRPSRDLVRERRREGVGRNRLASRRFARVRIDRRDLRLPVGRDLLHLRFAVAELAERPVAGECQVPRLEVELLRGKRRRRIAEIGRETRDQRDQEDPREDGADEAENETHLSPVPYSTTAVAALPGRGFAPIGAASAASP